MIKKGDLRNRMTRPACEPVEDLFRLLPHIEVAHHIPGRIRLRVRPSGLGLVGNIDIEAALLNIPGVRSLRINAFARTVVIEYNRERLPCDLWRSLEELKYKPELADELAHRLRSLREAYDPVS